MKPVERNPFLPLLAFALLVLLSVLSFMGYLLAARRLQAPPPAEVLTVLTPEGPHTLRGRVARTPEAWRRGLGLREEGLEALLYLFPEATERWTYFYGEPRVVELDGRPLRLEAPQGENLWAFPGALWVEGSPVLRATYPSRSRGASSRCAPKPPSSPPGFTTGWAGCGSREA